MGKTKPAETPGQPVLPLSDGGGKSEPAPASAGLSTLLRGSNNGPSAPGQTQGAQPREHDASRPRSSSLTWTLLAADALLVVLAVWQVVTRRGRLGFWGGLLTVLAVGLGAWLGCSAFLLRRHRD